MLLSDMFQYGLHDTEINSIECLNGKINLVFNDGVYILNEVGKETVKTSKCVIAIEIKMLNPSSPWEHITIYKARKNKFKDISLSDFIKLIDGKSFKIYLDYYCGFAKSLLLKGSAGKYNIELSLTEIEIISYIF